MDPKIIYVNVISSDTLLESHCGSSIKFPVFRYLELIIIIIIIIVINILNVDYVHTHKYFKIKIIPLNSHFQKHATNFKYMKIDYIGGAQFSIVHWQKYCVH